jgi:hypothetical protein
LGTHFCVFYETNDDLVEMLIPTSKPVSRTGSSASGCSPRFDRRRRQSALSRAVPRSDRHLIEKNIEFLGSDECYLKGGAFNLDRVTAEWGERLHRALASGYEGIRVSGYAGWLQTREWPDFWKYEGSLNKSIVELPMIVLCTYPLAACGAAEILDVAHPVRGLRRKLGGDRDGALGGQEEIRGSTRNWNSEYRAYRQLSVAQDSLRGSNA